MDICVGHQTYLGFSWRFNGVPRYFTFAVLPFGLSSACFCFTKLLRPLVKRWRSMSHGSFVVDEFVLPAINDLLLEGPGQRQIYASRPSVFRGCPKFRMLALRLDFR